jgi:phage portal protein BeeE
MSIKSWLGKSLRSFIFAGQDMSAIFDGLLGSSSGVIVNAQTVLKQSTVLACIRLISETLADWLLNILCTSFSTAADRIRT